MKRLKSPSESKLAFFNEIDNHDMNTKMMALNANNAIIELFEFFVPMCSSYEQCDERVDAQYEERDYLNQPVWHCGDDSLFQAINHFRLCFR